MALRWAARSSPMSLISRSGPTGKVTRSCTPPSATRTSSRLPPPRSPTTPSARGMPAITPRADRRASCRPDRMRTVKPHSCATRSTNAPPLSASRTAAVATTSGSRTFMSTHSSAKRRNVCNAASTASSAMRPVGPTARPRPHRTFSLNTVWGLRRRPSNTTRRTELDPMSMTPKYCPAAALVGPFIGRDAITTACRRVARWSCYSSLRWPPLCGPRRRRSSCHSGGGHSGGHHSTASSTDSRMGLTRPLSFNARPRPDSDGLVMKY